MFTCKSVGNLEIKSEEEQRMVYDVLSGLDYKGVLVDHCEKDSLLKPQLWNPSRPISHCYARPEESESVSVADQIQFACESGFKGRLHIAHVSVPKTVEIVDKARSKLRVSCGVTPHHRFLYSEMMNEPDGIIYKVNPPLRSRQNAEKMFQYLKEGKIDLLESDHAPHTLKDKTEKYMSGFPGLPFMPHFARYMKKSGFSDEQIFKLTHENPCRIFGIDIPSMGVSPDYNLHTEYEVDVYKKFRDSI